MMGFHGSDYNPAIDGPRLTKQHERVKALMLDGAWRTLSEISALTGDPAASVSAQLRALRAPENGAWTVVKRSRHDRSRGLYEYRLLTDAES